MKKIFVILVLFCILRSESTIAQSVRVNFIRYQQIEYNYYSGKWQSWPNAWNESGAYAIIKKIYGETYRVSIYKYDGSFIVSSTCTFDSYVTSQKRNSQNLPYLNCYKDPENDQVWTNVVSLESLLENVKGWKRDGAQLYLWIFNTSKPFAFLFE
jgi:hypothetical protein